MTPIYVIARSAATRQSIFQVVRNDRWIASPSARNDPNSCHCEERSDAAIYFQVVQDESWIASPSARNDSGDGSQ